MSIVRIGAALALALLWADPAHSQENTCGPWEKVVKDLADKYNEFVVADAVTDAAPQAAIALFMSAEGRTWTLVVIRAADRTACAVMSGTDWQDKPIPAGEGI